MEVCKLSQCGRSAQVQQQGDAAEKKRFDQFGEELLAYFRGTRWDYVEVPERRV